MNDDKVMSEAHAPASAGARWLSTFIERPRRLGVVMIAPAVIYIGLVVGVPFFLALYYSLTDITAGSRALHFVGLKNFASIIESLKFRTALRNTFVFAVGSQVLVIVLATALALALMKDFRGKWFVRLLILLPWVAPMSLGSIGWLWILDSIYSVINWTLETAGLITPDNWPIYLGKPYAGHGLRHRRARVAPPPTRHRDPARRAHLHPQGHPRRSPGRRSRLLAPSLPITLPLVLPDPARGDAFRSRLQPHRHDRGLRAHARRALDSTQVLASLAFFTASTAATSPSGAAMARLPVPDAAGRARCSAPALARRTEVV